MASSKSSKPWADGPYQLLESPAYAQGGCTPEIYVANEMALAHNMFIRGLNTIVLQAKGVIQKQDILDFLTFCLCWIETIHHHHHLEENKLFPDIERVTGQKGIMDGDIQGHAAFHGGLRNFKEYIEGMLKKDGEGYDGGKVKELVESFAEPIMKHFREEVPSLLALKKWDLDGSKVKQCFRDLEKVAMKESDKSRSHPIALGCTDNTYEGGKSVWPPLPWFVPYLVDWVYARKHRGAWRFNPSDFHGRPRELKFLAV